MQVLLTETEITQTLDSPNFSSFHDVPPLPPTQFSAPHCPAPSDIGAICMKALVTETILDWLRALQQ